MFSIAEQFLLLLPAWVTDCRQPYKLSFDLFTKHKHKRHDMNGWKHDEFLSHTHTHSHYHTHTRALTHSRTHAHTYLCLCADDSSVRHTSSQQKTFFLEDCMVVATTTGQNQLFQRLKQKNVENSKRSGEPQPLTVFNQKLHVYFQ